MINRDNYREFHLDDEAINWSLLNFKEWLKRLDKDKYTFDSEDIADLLYCYSGNENVFINELLLGFTYFKEMDTEEVKNYYKKIKIMENEISNFKLRENIVVHRFTKRKWFRNLFDNRKIRPGDKFSPKIFTSTTLVADNLLELAKEKRYDCILKIYLPIGTKGTYLKFKSSKLNEHEFLLPPNSTFKLLKKGYSFKYFKWIYECELI